MLRVVLRGSHLSEYGEYIRRGTFAQRAREAGSISVSSVWFIIISLVFVYLCKALFSGFLQFRGNFVDGQNNSKYHDCAPLEFSSENEE